jgi:anti-sigma regulatory factor (Ser/Thr protein kinase)
MSLSDKISLSPTASEVSRLNTWFDQKCIESGIEPSLGADLKLCINEVLANLISYGFTFARYPWAIVEIELGPGSASTTITDNGCFFDIRDWPASQERDLMVGSPGGFGVALIKERATRISYRRNGDWNVLKITCGRPTP